MRKYKINEGDLCIFDPKNLLGRKDTDIIFVVPIALNKKNRLNHLGNLWYCFSEYAKSYVFIREEYLYRIPESESLREIIVIRNPENLPEFNTEDQIALTKAISYIGNDTIDPQDSKESIANRLSKMLIKLKFYDNMNER